jgi:cytochrome P450
MNFAETVQRIVEPTVLRLYQWGGDPVARLMRADTRIDPYPLYADIRRRGLVRSRLGTWAAATHATATQVLLDKRFSSSPVHQKGYRPPDRLGDGPHDQLPGVDLLTMDPPDHTRIRRLVSGAFSPRAIAALEPWIRDRTEQLLDAADATGFDLVDAVAFPLPISVICHMLGVPAEDEASFRTWGHDVAATLEPQIDRVGKTRANSSERALRAYLRELVGRRRSDPDDSVLSTLIAAEEQGDRLSLDELVSTALLLLVAGFETTVSLIGNGTVALLSAPEQWERLREEPGLLPDAVEELLRYDSPVQLTSRTATEDLELDNTPIGRRTPIILAIGGANRDPDVFDEPDRLRIDRHNANRHLSFSLGIHHCLGAALARLEGRIAFEALTRRYSRLELAAAPTRRSFLVLRGYEAIPLRAMSPARSAG